MRKMLKSTIVRIVIMVIALVLPINIMTLVLSNKMLEENKKQIEQEITNGLTLNAQNLEAMMTRASRKLIYLSLNSDYLKMSSMHKDQKQSAAGVLIRSISDDLKSLQIDYPWIDLLYFYFPGNDYVVSTGYPGVAYNECREEIRTNFAHRGSTRIQQSVLTIDEVPLYFGSNIWNNINFGYMINLERLLDRFVFTSTETGSCIFIMDQNGQVVTKKGISYLKDHNMTISDLNKSSRYGVFTVPIGSTGLQLAEAVEWNAQIENVPFTMNVFRALSVLMTILVIPLILIYTRKWVIKPLNRLVKAIDKIEQGELDYRIKDTRESREFEQINRNFNSMMDQVQNLKIDIYEKELERKSIRMRYLSQQIQPHFILNAMNIIYCYEPEEYPLIQKLVLCISKYFRYIIKANDDFVMLGQEMDHIRNYLEIQKARYPESFFAIVEYEEDLADAFVPPLLIQNFVENCIKHSLKIGNKIAIYLIGEFLKEEGKETKLRIRVADTGEGIPDEILELIHRFMETGEFQPELGIGIQNTIERLRYLYGDKGSIRIWRDEHYSGTNVEIILPIYHAHQIKKEDNYEDFTGRR